MDWSTEPPKTKLSSEASTRQTTQASQTTNNTTETTVNVSTEVTTTPTTTLEPVTSTGSSGATVTAEITTQPITTTSGTTQPRNETVSTEPNKQEGDNTGVIIGGVIGGVVVLVLILLVVLMVYRRRKKKKPRKIPELPTINQLNEVEQTQRARNGITSSENHEMAMSAEEEKRLYENLNATGKPDERTDPALGKDGYLKSRSQPGADQELYAKTDESRLLTPDDEGVDGEKGINNVAFEQQESLYQNEDFSSKKQASEGTRKRLESMPDADAPSPPISNSLQQGKSGTSRAGDGPKTSSQQDSYIKGRVSPHAKDYVNLKGQGKGGPVLGVQPKTKEAGKANSNDKSTYENTSVSHKENKYANVIGKTEKDHYENVGKDTSANVEEDQYYENP